MTAGNTPVTADTAAGDTADIERETEREGKEVYFTPLCLLFFALMW